MTDPNLPPANWYPDPNVPGQQRYWDGTQWTSHHMPVPPPDSATAIPQTSATAAATTIIPAPTAVATAEPVADHTDPRRGQPGGGALSTLAMIAAILAIVLAFIPAASFVGVVLAVAAIVLGAVALTKNKPGRGKAATGLVVGVLAAFISFFNSVSFIGSLAAENEPTSLETTDSTAAPTPDETVEPEQAEEPTEAAPVDLANFTEVDERTFALLVKDPDAHVGEELIVYGSIRQFDAATGPCTFLANTSYAQMESSFDYSNNTFFKAGDANDDCPIAAPIVEDDHIKAWVTVEGSFSYDTQIGGNTTVPLFNLENVEILPPTEF